MSTVPKLRFSDFSGEWKNERTGKLFPKIRNGFVGTATPHYVDDGVLYLQGKNIKNGQVLENGYIKISEEFHQKQIKSQLQNRDIVMVQSGHVGECAQITGKYVGANCHALLVMSPIEEIETKFFVYLYYSDAGKRMIHRIKTGNTIEHILSSDLKEESLFVPELPEQQKIAAFLTAVDTKIEQLTQKEALLEQYRKGVMQKIFSQEIRFKADDGSEFPEWNEVALGELGKASMCKRILKEQTSVTGDVPFFKIGTFGGEPDAFISQELFDEYRNKYGYPKVGDILISASGTIGRTVIFDGKPAYFQDSNIVWIDNQEHIVSNAFLYFAYKMVTWTTQDTTIARLYNDTLRSIRIRTPSSLTEQGKVVGFLQSVDQKIQQVSDQLRSAKTFKKGLLQQMFV